MSFPWNVKPIAGILSDTFPLFGTRRRHYMLLAAGLAAGCWFLLGVVPRAHVPLLLAALGANVFLVVASTVMGGLMVEAGQRSASPDASRRCAAAAERGVAGQRAARRLPGLVAFGWTVGVATGMLVILAVRPLRAARAPDRGPQ